MADCPCQTKSRAKKDSICKKLSERYPVIFWMVWISLALIGFLTAIRLNTEISWKTFLYIVSIIGFIILFIILAILDLNKFGEVMQVEFKGAIMGQINRLDRPTKTREEWKKKRKDDLEEMGRVAAAAAGNNMTCSTAAGGCHDNHCRGGDLEEVISLCPAGGGGVEEPEFNCGACKAQGLKTRAEAEAAAAAVMMAAQESSPCLA